MSERFFIPTPTPTTRTKTDPLLPGEAFPVYLDAEGVEMMWSGNFPLPAIDNQVFVKMNKIGWAVVVGYFESHGYVGVMTDPIDPPKWLRKQIKSCQNDPKVPKWAKEGICCEFGNELSLKKPKKTV